MNNLSFFDLHCDTPFEMYHKGESFYQNSLYVSADGADKFTKYSQVMAIWTDKDIDDESGFESFLEIYDHLAKDVKNDPQTSFFDSDGFSARNTFIIACEDARILNGDLSRLDVLYDLGLRILTPVWGSVSCIGGAFNTTEGLTDFGKQVIRKCTQMNIIPDISHSSLQGSYDVFEICENAPVIASHSNSYALSSHPRNLNDEQFKEIQARHGLVGVNFCAKHLGIEPSMLGIPTLIKHIEHFMSLGGEDVVCFGSDFDGTHTPADIVSLDSMFDIANELARLNYSEELIHKIFYNNASNFFEKYIK